MIRKYSESNALPPPAKNLMRKCSALEFPIELSSPACSNATDMKRDFVDEFFFLWNREFAVRALVKWDKHGLEATAMVNQMYFIRTLSS